MNAFVTAMLLSGAFVVVAGLAVALWALVRVVLLKRKTLPLCQNRPEQVLVALAVVLAALASGYLFQTQSPGPVASEGAQIRIESSPVAAPDETVVMEGDVARQWQRQRRRGAAVFFSLPVLIVLFPLVFFAMSIRPFFQALAAALLAAQIAVGMSGYGILFIPGAFFMLLAAISALRALEAQARP